ncbi:hypothetical protein DXG01_000604, partial [Tephrocybe rancida]
MTQLNLNDTRGPKVGTANAMLVNEPPPVAHLSKESHPTSMNPPRTLAPDETLLPFGLNGIV